MAEYDNTNRGAIFTNDRKQNEKQPDFKGQINVEGKEYWLSVWNKVGAKGPFMSVSIEAKDAAPKPQPAAKPAGGMDHKIPF